MVRFLFVPFLAVPELVASFGVVVCCGGSLTSEGEVWELGRKNSAMDMRGTSSSSSWA